jgi:xanthine dehydrogenase YagR molybdenum-binding subunit
MMVAGNRPSAYTKVRIAAAKDGTVTAWESTTVGTSGPGNYGGPPLPYVFTKIPEKRIVTHSVKTNRGPSRAWRAPNHPQACFLTMSAMADAAARIGMDELEFFKKAADLTDRADVYREQLDIAANLIGYRDKAHPRGQAGDGPIRRGLGISMHTWGGRGHNADCDVTINPDGSVDVKIGTQDLGTGTRTVIDIVVADTLGLPLDRVAVNIGRNDYPAAGASGGSTTVGGVSGASRLAATAALNALFEVVAPKMNLTPDKLESRNGAISELGNPGNTMPWDRACGLLGQSPITKRGTFTSREGVESGLIDAGVGGVQIADVSVDIETGLVRMNEIAAVQDCGLIIDLETAESQVYGGLIMGITYALFEEAVYDPVTGRMLNPNMEFYKLAGLPDVGTMKVHMMTDEKYQKRGVIGLGEPPVVSPGAAISNAVANAVGVRVPELPLTADRVLSALAEGGKSA